MATFAAVSALLLYAGIYGFMLSGIRAFAKSPALAEITDGPVRRIPRRTR